MKNCRAKNQIWRTMVFQKTFTRKDICLALKDPVTAMPIGPTPVKIVIVEAEAKGKIRPSAMRGREKVYTVIP